MRLNENFLVSEKEQNNTLRYRPDIDGLRAVAILSVVLFHAFPTVFHGGFIGVDVFFVLSGFLISCVIFRSLKRNDFSFIDFYAHRTRRIFPALITVLLATFAIGQYVLLPDELRQLSKHVTTGAVFIQNFVLWQENGYFDTASQLKPLLHLWSLAIEEQFYLIYPFVIFIAWRFRLNLLYAIIFFCACSYALNIHSVNSDPVRTFYLPQTRFWELFAGALLAHLHTFKPQRLKLASASHIYQLHNVFSVTGLVMLLASIVTIREDIGFPGWWATMPVAGTMLLIQAGPQGIVNRWILANKAMIFVGLISYPLYLWHWPILSFASIVESETPALPIRVAAVILSFGLAWLTFVFVEKPIRYGRRSKLTMTLLCLSLITLAIIGQYSRLKLGQEHGNSLPDSGAVTDAYCVSNFKPTGDLCRVGIKAPPTTIVIGDSHAYRFFLGLRERQIDGQSSDNPMLFGQTACPYPAVAGSDCAKPFESVFNIVESTASIKTIVLTSVSIRHYIQHNRFDGVSAPYRSWEEMLDNAFTKFERMGRSVVIVIDNPMLDFDPKQCDVRPFRLTKNNLRQDCNVSARSYFNTEADYRKAIFDAAKKHPNVRVLDAASVFCDNERCSAMKSGQLLYDDNNHLSMHGVRLLVEAYVHLMK